MVRGRSVSSRNQTKGEMGMEMEKEKPAMRYLALWEANERR